MSGSIVVKAARQLREARGAESLALRKQIMKSKAVGSKECDLFQRIADSGKDYQDRIDQLQKFKSKSKAVTKTQTLQSEWKTEHAQLQRFVDNYERDIAVCLEVLVLHTTTVSHDSDDGAGAGAGADVDEMGNPLFDIHAVVDESSRLKTDLSEYRRSLKFQLHELQSMLQGVRKDARGGAVGTKDHVTGAGQGDEMKVEGMSGMSAASAIFADILLQMRTQHGEYWGPLCDTERNLWQSIKEDNRRITNMLREERISQQTHDLRRELQIVDGDDVEVEMFMEEWLTKLATLDNAHRSNLQQFAAERTRTSGSAAVGADKVGTGSSSEQKTRNGDGDGDGNGDDDGSVGNDEIGDDNRGDADGSDGEQSLAGGRPIDDRSVATDAQPGPRGNSSSMSESSSASHSSGISRTSGTPSSSKYRGWSGQEHEVFSKIFRRAQASGMQRRLLLEALRAQLPQRAEGDILAHEEWHRQMRVIAARQTDCVAAYDTARAELVKQASEQLKLLRQTLAETAAKAVEMEQWEAARAVQHERLQALRDEREARERAFAEEQRLLLEEQERKRAEEEAATCAERAVIKERVDEYKSAKQLLSEAQRRLREEAQRQADEALKREVERSRDKVQARREQLIEKMDQKRQREEEMRLAEEGRLEMLNRLASQVPYWDNILNAKANLGHITASVKGHEYQPCTEEAVRGHMPSYGFADGKVIQDARFRLAVALRQAGVHHSEAAKYAVLSAHPRPQLAIHGLI